ncbi:MAG: DUF1453 domain-containing protein [Luteibacter sp.]|jgi:hypothetical protein|uniref:DUF1453 domain-containing protein n=1 Tax=Luteibacter sp. TaxID=1886636 RepID=UPI002808B2DA|nr:DUF1453 domain-containing protein [Luteibacter sp.]MDQ7994326.1 DUF1453 domain-containing protein [Luteibacter sp.]MDQ8048626.1 DUF1453 domain-containing protein [Luteibacter sp.]
MLAPTTIPFIVAPLMAFAVYRRVRGSFGRQPIRTKRMTARIVIFAAIACLMMTSGLQDIRLAEGALGGLVLGGALAFVGLRLTRFESSPQGGDFYIPNPWLGAALTALLLGRMAWRFLVLAPLFQGEGPAVAHTPPPGNSPLTMLVVGLTIGYYAAYYAGILVHHRRFKRLAQAV